MLEQWQLYSSSSILASTTRTIPSALLNNPGPGGDLAAGPWTPNMIALQSVSSSLIGVSPVPDLSFAHRAITGRGRIKLIAASLRSAQSFTRVLFVPDPIVLETACEWASLLLPVPCRANFGVAELRGCRKQTKAWDETQHSSTLRKKKIQLVPSK